MHVKTLTADEKYLVLKRGNLTIPIQMELSEKQNFFSQFFDAFLKSRLHFKCLELKDDLHTFRTSDITDSENVVR